MRLKSEMLEAAFGRRDAILRNFNKLTLGLDRALKKKRKRLFRKDEDYRKEEFARRQKMDIEDVAVSVVAVEDLILSKLVWGKQSRSDLQFLDVRQMISTVPELDWKYMQKWAGVLGIDEVLQRAKKNE